MRKIGWTICCLCFLLPRAKAGDPPAYHDIRDSVDLQLHTVKQTLIESHPGIAYLEVINNSEDTLDLTLASQGSKFLNVRDSVNHTVLLPKNSFVFTEHLEVASTIYPGTVEVLYQLTIIYPKNGRPARASKVVTQEVEMGILGESGIMTVLGLNIFAVPFFLILPGFLFLVIWSSFLPPVYKTQKALLAPEKKEPFFWVATITLSLVLSIVYALIFGQHVWISYGLTDVFRLWMGSILLPVLLLFFLYLSIARKARYAAAKDFTVRDTAWIVLERLRKRQAGFFLDQGTSADARELVFRLGVNQSAAAEPGVIWYSYGMIAKKTDAVVPGSEQEKLYKKLVGYLRDVDADPATADLAALIELLKAAEEGGAIHLGFDKEPGVLASSGSFTANQPHKNIVHV